MKGRPDPSRQIVFHRLLVAARRTILFDALGEALGRIDPAVLKRQTLRFVPKEAQRLLAVAGIRDEHVFPLPAILETKPTLVGYYRLLLGVSQKRFYRTGSGMSSFKSMETRGGMTPRSATGLDEFCSVMAASLNELVQQSSPPLTPRDVAELPLLTLGAQLYGSDNNAIGQQATLDVFLAVAEIAGQCIEERTSNRIVIKNASGRRVVVALSGDPDLRVQEEFERSLRNSVAIEIKGGSDASNAYNRAGEAEKSHLKAKKKGFRDYWTIISLSGLDREKLAQSSPTTNSWFDVAQVLARSGADWAEFRNRLAGAIGIPVS